MDKPSVAQQRLGEAQQQQAVAVIHHCMSGAPHQGLASPAENKVDARLPPATYFCVFVSISLYCGHRV